MTETKPADQSATDAVVTEPTDQETDWKSEAEKWKALSRKNETAAKENAAKAKNFDDLELANKTELERAQSEAATAKADLEKERLETKRLQLASQHGITGEYLELFTGSSIEDLEAKAPKIAALMPAPAETTDTTGIRELVVTAEGKSPSALTIDPLAAMLTQAVQ